MCIRDRNIRHLLSDVSSKFYKSKPKNIIAVTGTNGKTSVADLFYQIFRVNNFRVASIGTLGIKYNDEKYVSNDPENIEPQIPDYYQVDTSVNSINGPYILTFGINNIFDKKIYDFAISSTFHDDNHYGLSNVYPLPGRNLFFDLAYTF